MAYYNGTTFTPTSLVSGATFMSTAAYNTVMQGVDMEKSKTLEEKPQPSRLKDWLEAHRK